MRVRATGSDGTDKRGGGNLPLAAGVVVAGNYFEKALAHMRLSGRADGSHPVIRKPGFGVRNATPEAWDAWMAFFERLGPANRIKFARSQDTLTVPEMYPWDFSVDADWLRPINPMQGRYSSLEAV